MTLAALLKKKKKMGYTFGDLKFKYQHVCVGKGGKLCMGCGVEPGSWRPLTFSFLSDNRPPGELTVCDDTD